MSSWEVAFYYVSAGMVTMLGVLLWPQSYLQLLTKCLLWIKIAQAKLQGRVVESDQIQQDHEAKITEQTQAHQAEIQQTPRKINKDLVVLLLGWPLILLIIILGVGFRIFYLQSSDLPKKD